MSSSRLRNFSKGENLFDARRDVTPKSVKGSKAPGMFSNGKLFLKDRPQPSQHSLLLKSKADRPTTTKNSESLKKYFSSKENEDAEKRRNSNFNSIRGNQSSDKAEGTSQAIRWKSRSPKRLDDNMIKEEIFINPKKYNIGSRDIKHSMNKHPKIPHFVQNLPNYEPAKHSVKANGIIKCYAACTNQGPCRTYNEDRVAIILNTSKPEHCTVEWKKPAFFGVYDGHGGVACADYLRDNLHSFLFKEKLFPSNIPEAMMNGFQKCQTTFLEKSKSLPIIDKSGSCAVVAFVYGDTCYIGNVGDSRAILSSSGGQRVSQLSIDHKPSDDYEQKRITQHGGKIYQLKIKNANPNLPIVYEGEQLPYLLGPCRVIPGRLAVTRSIGDIEAKLNQFGGNPKVVIATPQIRSFKITQQSDFILLASDGIFDKLSNDQIVQIIWQTAKQKDKYKTVHEFCGLAIEKVMKYSVYKRTQDNITVVILGFENLEKLVMGSTVAEQKQVSKTLQTQNSSVEKQKLDQSRTRLNKTPISVLDRKKPPYLTTSYSFLDKNKNDGSFKKEQFNSRYSPTAHYERSMSFKKKLLGNM